MTPNETCSVEGCDGAPRSLGLCSRHYYRQRRHGTPLGGGPVRATFGEPERFYREVVLSYGGDECLLWPFAKRNGYGSLKQNGRMVLVPRLVCEEEHGSPPTPDHQAAHSCGKGHLGCVTKRHLSWKTCQENHADKIGHGTHLFGESIGNSKLTEAQVDEIKGLVGTLTQQKIANRFGVDRSLISLIQRGKIWRTENIQELATRKELA